METNLRQSIRPGSPSMPQHVPEVKVHEGGVEEEAVEEVEDS